MLQAAAQCRAGPLDRSMDTAAKDHTLRAPADARGCPLSALPLREMQQIEPGIDDGVFSVLGVDASVASRTSEGGTAPARVREAAAEARRRFLG